MACALHTCANAVGPLNNDDDDDDDFPTFWRVRNGGGHDAGGGDRGDHVGMAIPAFLRTSDAKKDDNFDKENSSRAEDEEKKKTCGKVHDSIVVRV